MTDETYDLLLDDISCLYEEKIGMGVRQRNEQLVASYWEIGDRIVQGESESGITVRYGKGLMKQLSLDLTARFGGGFGMTNLFTIRRFRLTYEQRDIDSFFTWAHYKTLLGVKDDARRKALEAQAIAEQMPDTKLKALARLANGLTQVEEGEAVLTPRAGRLHLYKVVEETMDDGSRCLVDCGFQVRRSVELKGVKTVTKGELLHSVKTGKTSYRFKRGEFAAGERYCYRAKVLKVIDGDTLLLRVDLGFEMFIDDRFRLRGVNAAEIGTRDGKAASRFVKRKLRTDTDVVVLTYGCDMYGRYLADVFYGLSDRQWQTPLVTADDSRFLNAELVDKGYAGYWGAMRWE